MKIFDTELFLNYGTCVSRLDSGFYHGFYEKCALYIFKTLSSDFISYTSCVLIVVYSRPARVIKPRRNEDAPRAAAAARKPVVPASSVQQKPARRGGDFAKPSGGGYPPKKHSPSVAPSGPGARHKGGKPVKVCI